MIEELQYKWFKKKILEFSGVNLDNYRDIQIRRRIFSYMENKGIRDFVEFYKLLVRDKDLFCDFNNFLTINVSYFFRDIDKWEKLKNEYLPSLLSKKESLRIWSAGCSIGCEPYTMAIILEEHKKKIPFTYSILATDVDVEAINKAEEGTYTLEELKYVKDEILTKYFRKENGKFKIKEILKENVIFQIHDLFKNDFQSNFHLIICRNTIIHFDDKAKLNLYKKFYNSLKDNGILFIGSSEIILRCEELGFKSLSMCFYQKSCL